MRRTGRRFTRLSRRRIIVVVLSAALVLGGIAAVVHVMTGRCQWRTVHHGHGELSLIQH